MIVFTFSINYFFSVLGLGNFESKEIISLFENCTLEEIMTAARIILWGIFQRYGISFIVFHVDSVFKTIIFVYETIGKLFIVRSIYKIS